jgi:hypothetical protein
MQVATILPTPLLSANPDPSYSMCLYQEVKRNAIYGNYFKELKKQGNFVIMDNGAAEGVNPTAEELMEIYPYVDPSEIILPDVVYDRIETITRTKKAYSNFIDAGLHKKYQFMAVPQGSNYPDWLRCMKEMIRQDSIDTIGISKFVTPRYQVEMGGATNVRLECVDAILNEAGYLKREINIHLLGCWCDPAEIQQIEQVFPGRVRGTDSAIAYVYARAGVEYKPTVLRPDNKEIDFTNGTVSDLELLKKNIQHWRSYCK